MDANKVVRFEDMPKVLSSLLTEVQQLHSKVDSINSVVNQKQEKPNRILSIQEVSKMIHKATSTVYKMVSKSGNPCYKQGKTVTFIEDEILEWMKQYKRGSATEMMALAEQYLQRIQ